MQGRWSLIRVSARIDRDTDIVIYPCRRRAAASGLSDVVMLDFVKVIGTPRLIICDRFHAQVHTAEADISLKESVRSLRVPAADYWAS